MCDVGLHDILHARHAHLVSKDVNLHQLFSDGVAVNTQSRSSLTSNRAQNRG